MRLKKLAVGAIMFLGMMVGIWGWENRGIEVVRIVDGDNVELGDGRRIRYINVDAPEKGECFRNESVKMNEEMVLGKKVRVELDKNEMDRFGRYLAYVWVEEKMVNEELLKMGAGEYQLDTVNLKYQQRLAGAAVAGHEARVGKWQECGKCEVKGNLDKDDKRWYHLPGFRHYDRVVVRLDLGDRWFCSEKEAIEAGFKRARE